MQIKNTFKPMNIKATTYDDLEKIRKEIGERHLTKTIEFLIKLWNEKEL
jgi:hypothetical protein